MEKINKRTIKQSLLKKLPVLCNTHGVSGYETDVEAIVVKDLEDYVDDVHVDPLGNVIGRKNGNGQFKLMVAAHMDEIGLMVRHIDERGFLYVEKLGGVRAQNLFSRTCVIKTKDGFVDGLINSVNPGRPKSMTEIPEVSEFFVDVGANTKKEAEEMGIEIGNTISIDYDFKMIGKNKVIGTALDNRLLVFILLEAMKLVKETDIQTPELYPVFTVQEEVGCRGAKTAAYSINPDAAIALDISIANDTPQIPLHENITTLDEGPAIKLMDKVPSGNGLIASPKIVESMKNIAKVNDLNYQLEVISAGTTDAATIHLERGGIPSGGILVPTRYVHAHEMASIDDIVESILLLYYYIKSLGESGVPS